MDITIRQATTKDFATIQSLNQLLFDEEYETNDDDALDLHWPQSEEAIEYYRKKLSSPDSIVFVVYGKNEHAIHFYDAMGFTLWEVGMERKL